MFAALLMAALAGGPLDGFRAELATATQRGYVAAFRWLGTSDESREACQEAAARALGAADRYDPGQPFYPWFYGILRNHCIDRLRERRRIADTEAGGSVDCSAESMLVQGERERAVSEAIRSLPEELREVIELRHFQDATYEEMAAILDCPLGTVMSRLYRARQKLREKLLRDPRFRNDPTRDGGVR
jgi:RNA polymerase sigma-70 factor (ECF subfamily)